MLLLGLCLLAGSPARASQGAAAGGAAKEVTPTGGWRGSVEDESLLKKAPADGVLTSARKFGDLIRAWKVRDKVPAVDFRKSLVLVQTTSGSKISTTARLTKDGDLKVLGVATLDFAPGFRYQILVVPREGVRTVNGKKLPQD
jgi:hypothetical protein